MNFVIVHLPKLISIYIKILNKIRDISGKEENIKPKIENKKQNQQPKKKVRPNLPDKEIGNMILKQVFKVPI